MSNEGPSFILMVNWRSTSSFAVLLQLSRLSSRTIQLNGVSPTSSSLNHKRQDFNSSAPRDDDNRDTRIDLTALRSAPNDNKEDKSEHSTPTYDSHHHTNAEQAELRLSSGSVFDPAVQALASNHTAGNNVERKGEPLRTKETTMKAFDDEPSWQVRIQDSLDPYLVQFLKSVAPKSSHKANYETNKQDLDLEFLLPDDVRAAHNIFKKELNIDPKPVSPFLGFPPYPKKTENSFERMVRLLELRTPGNPVIIPRATLIKLIEETITLSGAALRGDDVVIETYSPAWHRFARLLRTSDLHAISKLEAEKRHEGLSAKERNEATPSDSEEYRSDVMGKQSKEKDNGKETEGGPSKATG